MSAEVSYLDQLMDPEYAPGVRLGPKAKPAPDTSIADAVKHMAEMLAASQKELAKTLSNRLISQSAQPMVAPAVEKDETPVPKTVTTSLTRGADGKINGGVVSNGTSTWRLVIARTDDSTHIEAIPNER